MTVFAQKRGPGGGQGGGAGGGGRGGGGRGGGFGGGPGGSCVCMACGHQEPHQRGVPCFDVKCPKCGGTMTRER
jgi:electron transport complex protein RnfB